jgi:hypothetical protein
MDVLHVGDGQRGGGERRCLLGVLLWLARNALVNRDLARGFGDLGVVVGSVVPRRRCLLQAPKTLESGF